MALGDNKLYINNDCYNSNDPLIEANIRIKHFQNIGIDYFYKEHPKVRGESYTTRQRIKVCIPRKKTLFGSADCEYRAPIIAKFEQSKKIIVDICNEYGIAYDMETKEEPAVVSRDHPYADEKIETTITMTIPYDVLIRFLHDDCKRENEKALQSFISNNRLKGKEGPEKFADELIDKIIAKTVDRKNKWDFISEKIRIYPTGNDIGFAYNGSYAKAEDSVRFTGYDSLSEDLRYEMAELTLQKLAKRILKQEHVLDVRYRKLIHYDDRTEYRLDVYFEKLNTTPKTKSWL